MWLKKVARSVETSIGSVSRVMNIAGIAALAAIMLLTVGDVLMRYLLKKPIIGSAEIATFLMTWLCLGMGWCMVRGKSIKMDMVVEHLPARVQAAIDSVTYFLSLVLLIMMTWRVFLEFLSIQESHLVSATARVPAYPFHFVLWLSFVMFCLALLLNLVKNIAKAIKE